MRDYILCGKHSVAKSRPINAIEANSRSKVRRQSQYMSFNLDYLDIEDEIICRRYTQVCNYCWSSFTKIEFNFLNNVNNDIIADLILCLDCRMLHHKL